MGTPTHNNDIVNETKTVSIRNLPAKTWQKIKVYAVKNKLSIGEAVARLVNKGLRG